MKKVIIIVVAVTIIGLILLGVAVLSDQFVGKRVANEILMTEHLMRAEFAEHACIQSGEDLRIYALTNYCEFLENDGRLLPMSESDVKYSLFLTHGRLFKIYNSLSNEVEISRHYVSASNLFWSLRSKPLTRTFLLTNTIFNGKM